MGKAQETIKYGMPTFVFHGNLVYFGAWKHHIGFYPITRAMEESIEELAAYKTSGKGTIQFPFSQPLPLPHIRTIVQQAPDDSDSWRFAHVVGFRFEGQT